MCQSVTIGIKFNFSKTYIFEKIFDILILLAKRITGVQTMNKQEYKAARAIIRDNGVWYGLRQIKDYSVYKAMQSLHGDHTDWLSDRAWWYRTHTSMRSPRARLLNTTRPHTFIGSLWSKKTWFFYLSLSSYLVLSWAWALIVPWALVRSSEVYRLFPKASIMLAFILPWILYGIKYAIAGIVPILTHSIKYNTLLGRVFAIAKSAPIENAMQTLMPNA